MSPLKVLVADDDAEVLEIYRMSLCGHYEVLTARDGLEAWKLFNESRPRLVLSDLNMPGVNGQELAEKIRSHENARLAETPIIIITGTTCGTDLPPGFWRIGTAANLMLEKPVSPDEILQAVRSELVKSMSGNPLPPGKGYYECEKSFANKQ